MRVAPVGSPCMLRHNMIGAPHFAQQSVDLSKLTWALRDGSRYCSVFGYILNMDHELLQASSVYKMPVRPPICNRSYKTELVYFIPSTQAFNQAQRSTEDEDRIALTTHDELQQDNRQQTTRIHSPEWKRARTTRSYTDITLDKACCHCW